MKTKTGKFLMKSLFVVPFTFMLFLVNGINKPDYWWVALIYAIPTACGIMLWQLFEYEKFNNMSQADLLESVHEHTLENTNETWRAIRAKIHSGFEKYTIEEDRDGYIVLKLNRFLIPSVLKVIKKENHIKITIERTFFNFMPDNAKNYKTLKRLLYKLTD